MEKKKNEKNIFNFDNNLEKEKKKKAVKDDQQLYLQIQSIKRIGRTRNI